MNPRQLSAALVNIANRIDASNNPQRNLVAADLKKLIVALENPDDYKSGSIIDGIFLFFDNKEAGAGKYKINGTSYKEINGFVTIDGENGSWVFYLDPEGDGSFKLTGRVNGEEISEIFTPEVDEDPKDFGKRMIVSLFESDSDLKSIFDGKFTFPPAKEQSHSFDWEDEPLGAQPYHK